MNATELIKEFGNEIGLNSLSFDGNGVCRIVFDKKLDVSMEYVEAQNLLYVYSVIGKLPAVNRETIYEKLLDANFFAKGTGGGVLCIDRNLGEIVLFLRYLADNLDFNRFKKDLEIFLSLIEQWQNKLMEFAVSAPTDTDTSAYNASMTGGFIRV